MPAVVGDPAIFSLITTAGQSRRYLLVGDSHSVPVAQRRWPGSVMRGYALMDVVGYQGDYGQTGGTEATSLLIPRADNTIAVPGDSVLGASLTCDWCGGQDMVGNEPNTSANLLQGMLVGDAPWAGYGASVNPWNGTAMEARAVLYWPTTSVTADAGSVLNVVGMRGTTGDSGAWNFAFSSQGLIVSPWRTIPSAGTETWPQLQLRGTASQDTNGKRYYFCGMQFTLPHKPGIPPEPPAGFVLDCGMTFSGWDTDDHARPSGPSRHYTDANLGQYLKALRLRADEALIVQVLLGHADGGNTAPQYAANLQTVIGRYKTAAATAGYQTVKFVVVHPWYSPTALEQLDAIDGHGVGAEGAGGACVSATGSARRRRGVHAFVDGAGVALAAGLVGGGRRGDASRRAVGEVDPEFIERDGASLGRSAIPEGSVVVAVTAS